jgi:hypothetical protein
MNKSEIESMKRQSGRYLDEKKARVRSSDNKKRCMHEREKEDFAAGLDE